jgi:hypothetical protein
MIQHSSTVYTPKGNEISVCRAHLLFHIHHNASHNTKMDLICVYINGWIYKNMVYFYHRLLFSLEKGGIPVICDNVEGHFVKLSTERNIVWSHLYIEFFLKADVEKRMVIKGWGVRPEKID